jgi:hypothetical protein
MLRLNTVQLTWMVPNFARKKENTNHESVTACVWAVAFGSHFNPNLHQTSSINRTSSRAFSLRVDLTANRCLQRTSRDNPILQEYMSTSNVTNWVETAHNTDGPLSYLQHNTTHNTTRHDTTRHDTTQHNATACEDRVTFIYNFFCHSG